MDPADNIGGAKAGLPGCQLSDTLFIVGKFSLAK
jgi:hypothetical protein